MNPGAVALQRWGRDLAQSYAWIVLLPDWRYGVAVGAIAILAGASSALYGLAGGLTALLGARAAGAYEDEVPVAGFNGILLGTWLGLGQPSASTLWALTGLCLALGASVVPVGRALLTRTGLSLYSAPFSLVAVFAAAGGGTFMTFNATPGISTAAPLVMLPQTPPIGALLFLSNPWTHLCLLLVIALASRYYLALLLGAWGLSAAMLSTWGTVSAATALSAQLNALLSALLVGGLLARPSLVTAAYAVAAALGAALLSMLLDRTGTAHWFALPFVLASWSTLAVLRRHPEHGQYLTNQPQLPERSHLQALQSSFVPTLQAKTLLAIPFDGIWTVSQGADGAHTHVGTQRHALDFIRVTGELSYTETGATVMDFFAFGQPIYAPASGEVVAAVGHLPDNAIGAVDIHAPWGNHVVIRLENGLFAVLAHLQCASLAVMLGTRVAQGQLLAHCGNSGRSPQPHLHLHVQTGALVGSPTVPFRLANLWLDAGQTKAHYALDALPSTGQTVAAAAPAAVFPFPLLPGRGLRYQLASDTTAAASWTLECTLTPTGQWQLLACSGARCTVTLAAARWTCYERNAVQDPAFDAWLLACANIPSSSDAVRWTIEAHAACDSMHSLHRRMALLLAPWRMLLRSQGSRNWEESCACWVQTLEHGHTRFTDGVRTEALISPRMGAIRVRASWANRQLTLHASALFQRGDIGTPAWEVPLATTEVP